MTADTNINVIPVMFDEDSESSIVTAITMVADPATRRPAVLPFQRQSSRQEALLAHTTATPGGMSLTGYAAFCAALAQPGVATEEVCARYGVDEDARQRLDQAWYAHFDTDPRLHQLWGQLYTTFHSLLNEHP